MADENRRVEVDFGFEKVEGRFIKWGNDAIRNDDGDMVPVTVAIVEKTDGKVIAVDPAQIRFLDQASRD